MSPEKFQMTTFRCNHILIFMAKIYNPKPNAGKGVEQRIISFSASGVAK